LQCGAARCYEGVRDSSGALTGLTRVRRFKQDDVHIFCLADQIKEELIGCFDFLSKVYETFGFQFKLLLSTRDPNKFIGDIKMWEKAEQALADALDERSGKGNWGLNPGDGAF
jgi:threonyl-tRNA synthetase